MSNRLVLFAVLAALAVAGGAGAAVAALPRDDIPVYTAPTVPVYTAPTVPVYTSPTVQPDKPASQIDFYKATIIKPLPRSAAIRRIASHGFSLPSRCNWLCSVYSWAITDNVAWALLDKNHTIGKASVKNHAAGNVRLTLKLTRRVRRKLARLHRKVSVTVRERVVDAATGYSKQYRRRITLHP